MRIMIAMGAWVQSGGELWYFRGDSINFSANKSSERSESGISKLFARCVSTCVYFRNTFKNGLMSKTFLGRCSAVAY